jgi:alkanesulfonate monooxygenase SsuD/methylene tetrahydromethanopterin reductase-like flavin-dependent oxidoreductase (luciferase family)
VRIGISIPIGERGLPLVAWSYREMRELAQKADEGGLNSIWVADHLFNRPPTGPERGTWSSMSVLAALADATESVELGTLVMCTPFRNPGMIAWEANTIDEISGGRFVLGMGAGWHQPEFDAFGFEFEHKVSYFEDTLNIVAPLLRDGHVDYQGKLARGAASLHPRGPRPKGPPIMIAGSGPRMLRLTAQFADRFNSAWFGLPNDDSRAERDRLVDACKQIGRDPQTLEINVGLELADPASTPQNTPQNISGRAPAILDALRAWQAEGVAEVICRMNPSSLGMADEVIRAAQELRAD